MSMRTQLVHRTTAPGLLGLLERELSWLNGIRGVGPRDDPMMRCEEFAEPGKVVVRAELPGLDPDSDVEVTVADGVLRIAAHRREEQHDGLRSEFFYGEMIRTLMLPEGADEKEITAAYRDGILEVVVPTGAAERPAPLAVPVARAD